MLVALRIVSAAYKLLEGYQATASEFLSFVLPVIYLFLQLFLTYSNG